MIRRSQMTENLTYNSTQKNDKKSKYYKILLISIILFIILIIFISFISIELKSKSKKYRNLTSYNNDPYQTKEKEKANENDIVLSIIIITAYFVYMLMSLYMICMMKVISEKSESYQIDVYKFIYMSNNGFLFISLIDTVISGTGLAIACLGICLFICITGTIIYIVKFIHDIAKGFINVYMKFEIIGLWICLPFESVWPFLALTDPCCYQDTYTVTVYSDGTTTSDLHCVLCWNRVVYGFKRFAMLVATILYYMFLLMLFLVWLFIKLIIFIVEKIQESCAKKEDKIKIILELMFKSMEMNKILIMQIIC